MRTTKLAPAIIAAILAASCSSGGASSGPGHAGAGGADQETTTSVTDGVAPPAARMLFSDDPTSTTVDLSLVSGEISFEATGTDEFVVAFDVEDRLRPDGYMDLSFTADGGTLGVGAAEEIIDDFVTGDRRTMLRLFSGASGTIRGDVGANLADDADPTGVVRLIGTRTPGLAELEGATVSMVSWVPGPAVFAADRTLVDPTYDDLEWDFDDSTGVLRISDGDTTISGPLRVVAVDGAGDLFVFRAADGSGPAWGERYDVFIGSTDPALCLATYDPDRCAPR